MPVYYFNYNINGVWHKSNTHALTESSARTIAREILADRYFNVSVVRIGYDGRDVAVLYRR